MQCLCYHHIDFLIHIFLALQTSALQYAIETKEQEQQKCKTKDSEISSLKEQLHAAELGFKKDDEEWRQDYDILEKRHDVLKEKNEELQKENEELQKENKEMRKEKKMFEQEVDGLKGQVQAAELALKVDDEEWRQDYNEISGENKSLKEEIDGLKQEIESLKQEKDTLETKNAKMQEENDALKTEKENTDHLHQSHLDAVLLSQKEDNEEWRLDYHRLTEKCDSLKLENDKLLKQQLEVALIGRRKAIEEIEDMETSLQTAAQENIVLKVANEEAEKEVMLLNNDKSMFTQKVALLQEQLRIKEKDILATNESANRELTEVNAKLVSALERNHQLQQTASAESHSEKQWSLSQQSLYNELNNIKLQLTKTKAENEKVHYMYSESLNKANMLQSELLSIKAQLTLQRELQERDAKLLHIKEKTEEELRATINKLNQKIELLQQDRVTMNQNHSVFTKIDYLDHSKTAASQKVRKFTSETHSVDNDDHSHKKVDQASGCLLTSDPMQSLSASLYKSRTSESDETIVSHQATASVKLNTVSDVAEQVLPIASSSMPSLQNNNDSFTTALYARKFVCTASGEDAVMCKQVIKVSDVSCGERVIIHNTNDKHEYGTVRAFPSYINGNINFVGIELDLPSMLLNVCTYVFSRCIFTVTHALCVVVWLILF